MRKRILSLILTVLMVVSLFSAFSVNVNAANITFQYNPTVYIGGGGYYNIVWKNNLKSIGYVTYRYNGKNYTVYDEENGVVRSDDNTHTVRVPQEHLDGAGSYTVYAAEVTSRDGYDIRTGSGISYGTSFTGYHGQNEIKFGFVSDTHLWKENMKCRDSAKIGINNYMGGVDVLVLNGDIANNMPTEDDFNCILDIANSISEGKYPVLYVKGNHECRGYYSQKLYKYLVYDTNEFYCQFDYGPISAIVCDIGEDKPDDHIEYGGLDDMEHYIAEQLEWVSGLDGFSKESEYKLTISHDPQVVSYYFKTDMQEALKNYAPDVHVAGHSHAQKFVAANDKNNDLKYPIVHDGGHDNNATMRTTLMTCSNGQINFKAYTDSGSVSWEQTIAAAPKGASPKTETTATVEETVTETVDEDVVIVEEETEAAASVPTAAGVSTMAFKGASTSDTTKIVTSPVVFDAGAYYNIVWQTTPGIECAGYAKITNSTGTVSYMDSFAGKLRVETTHSVKVPKGVLQNSTFTISSRVVTNYNMYGLVRPNDKTSYGPEVFGPTVKFDGAAVSNQKKYTILALTNALGDTSVGKEIRSAIKTMPDFVVTLGNMVANLNTEEEFAKYLNILGTVTDNGKVPVLMLRGDGETIGEFAANLGCFIRTTTGESVIGKFYNNFNFGDVSVIGLDTAATKADSTKEYNGYANFQPIREEQLDWMVNTVPNSQRATYNIVFANAADLTNVLGVDYTDGLVDTGINLVVTGGGAAGAASYNDSGKYVVASAGSPKGDNSNGLLITCAGEEITIERMIGTDKEELGVFNVNEYSADNKGSDDPVDDPDDPVDDPDNPVDDPDDPVDDPDDEPTTNNQNNNSNNTNNNTNTGTNGTTTTTKTEIVKGEYDGLETNYYVRTVEEGWYEDYIGLYTIADVDKVASNGVLTEAVFVHMVARLVAVDYSYFSSETDNADKASAWIESCGIYSGYLGGETPVTDSTIDAVVSGIFKEA